MNDSNTTELPINIPWAFADDSDNADDAVWILTATYIIFTMQTGFGLLEAGCVSQKNEVNIMAKNALDVIFGGISYWLIGYGLSFGDWKESNPFVGVGDFALDVGEDPSRMGTTYLTFIFQLSFATTATTIVSGAMAERVKLDSYVVFAFINVLIYVFPAHWVWASNGFLYSMGIVDIAGSGVVHLTGGVIGLVATIMLKPREGRFKRGPNPPPLGNGTNVIVGTFMLWWGWLGFNCGSTLGLSGGRWQVAAKTATTTLNASVAAGFVAVIISYIMNRRKFNVSDMVNAVLGGLVAITAPCAVVRPWESVVIGAIGGVIAMFGTRMFDRLHVDDPVGAISVHGLAGIWGMLSVGLFMNVDTVSGLNNGQVGLFHGGGWYSLGVQAAGVGSIIAWTGVTSFIILLIIQLTMGLRMTPEHELEGADYHEHDLGPKAVDEYYAGDKEYLAKKYTGSVRSAFGTRTDGFTETSNDISADVEAAEADTPEVRKRSVRGSGVDNHAYQTGKHEDFSQL